MLNRVLDTMRNVTNCIVVLLFGIVVAVVFAQVVARYAVGSSIRWADELARFAFVWLVYLGGTITIREGKNVCFDLLLEHSRGNRRVWTVMFSLVNLASASFLVLMTYLGILVCRTQLVETSPILRWPMAFVTLAIPVGGALMLFEQISYYIRHIGMVDTELEGEV